MKLDPSRVMIAAMKIQISGDFTAAEKQFIENHLSFYDKYDGCTLHLVGDPSGFILVRLCDAEGKDVTKGTKHLDGLKGRGKAEKACHAVELVLSATIS